MFPRPFTGSRRGLGQVCQRVVTTWFWLLFSTTILSAAPTPDWIWHPNNGQAAGDGEVRYFRKAFSLDAQAARAELTVSADNHFVAYLNGQKIGAGDDWESPGKFDVTQALRLGENQLAVEARNDSGIAALLVRLRIEAPGQRPLTIVSDSSWNTSSRAGEGWVRWSAAADSGWVAARSLGRLGAEPWGNVLAGRPGGGSRGGGGNRQATPDSQLTTLPDFEVKLLHNALVDEGSWICMTPDPKGRLIISPQDIKQPLWRFTLGPDGAISKRESIALGVGEAMGLLCAFDSLYANARGPQGTGVYRLTDTNADDQYDKVEFLKTMQGGGEHGPHGIALGPDQKLYVINGNHTKVPEAVSAASPHSHYDEDLLLPRDWDGNGHARGILAPGGYIVRTDKDGQSWDLMLAGYRNAYDLAINDEGEMFTFDSDMEWDWGMPWYRPTVIYHSVSGADFGWRSGTGKWPWYYPDALPPVAEVGIGSPTGVHFGRGAKFPAKYQKALYVMDWSYGRILAAHLKPEGASYRADLEPFVTGRPLNVADMSVGRDGHFYFVTGGRGTQSGLYRVRYTGSASTAAVPLTDEAGREARALRRRLEAFHGRPDPAAVAIAWPHLNHPDRFIRHAARIAIESQPVQEWREKALAETSVEGSLTALLALARRGGRELQDDLLESLGRYWPDQLDTDQKLAALRIASLAFLRMGQPSADTIRQVTADVDPVYPSGDPRLDRELCQILVYLQAPTVVKKTLDLIEKAATQEDQIHYVVALRTLRSGWTLDQRGSYFSWYHRDRAGMTHPPELLKWFEDVGREYSDGASFKKFLENFKKEAVATLPASERTALADVLEGRSKAPLSVPSAPARSFVKEWTMADLEPHLDQVAKRRSFDQGRRVYGEAQCAACHKFGDEGGATGQELTAVASRYTRRDILDSILTPSKVVSEQYQNTTYQLKDGEEVTGKVIDEADGKWVILVDPIHNTTVQVAKDQVKEAVPSTLSPMPEGLLNVLTRDEILDLLAYLESGGRADHAAFAKP